MKTWMRKRIAIPVLSLLAVTALACGGGSANDTGTAAQPDKAGATGAAADGAGEKKTDGVYKFGQKVVFKDGSELTVAKPVSFDRDKFAAGGEKAKKFLKFKVTFTNKTDKVFDPTLTTAAATGGGEEGEAIYQDGLDSPSNKLLPGKSVSWWAGYGLGSDKDLQLEVTVGFLDYGTVIFTR